MGARLTQAPVFGSGDRVAEEDTPAERTCTTEPAFVAKGSSLLLVRQPWIDMLLDGEKSLEIRGEACNKRLGQRFYLALAGGGEGGLVLGSVQFRGCSGPLDVDAFRALAAEHCCGADALPPYQQTYAWRVESPRRFQKPLLFSQPRGAVKWIVAKANLGEPESR